MAGARNRLRSFRDRSVPAVPGQASTSRALQEAGFLLQLALMALLPLVNALYFDWDAGLVAGLIIAEALLMLALLPLLWTALEWRHHRQQPVAGRPAFRWPRRLLGNLFGGLLILAVGGVLPTVFLSVLAPDWMEWASNHAVTHLGVPAVLTLFLWPFLLGPLIWPDWPSYSLSLAAVLLLTVVHIAGLCWLALSPSGDGDSVEDEATALLTLSTFPLFLMAAIAYGISRWLAEERLFLPPLDRVDLAMWTLVLLGVMRGLAGALMRRAQQADRARRQGRAGLARLADSRLLFGAGAGLAILLLAGVALLAGSSPRPVAPAADVLMADCLANWPGQFAESSRAELDRNDRFARVSADRACQHILAARSLRLQQAVDPDDLARFQGLEKLELVGPAAVHAADLHRLGALDEVHFTRPGVLDAALIRPPPTLTGVVVVDGSLRSAEQLWRLGGRPARAAGPRPDRGGARVAGPDHLAGPGSERSGRRVGRLPARRDRIAPVAPARAAGGDAGAGAPAPFASGRGRTRAGWRGLLRRHRTLAQHPRRSRARLRAPLRDSGLRGWRHQPWPVSACIGITALLELVDGVAAAAREPFLFALRGQRPHRMRGGCRGGEGQHALFEFRDLAIATRLGLQQAQAIGIHRAAVAAQHLGDRDQVGVRRQCAPGFEQGGHVGADLAHRAHPADAFVVAAQHLGVGVLAVRIGGLDGLDLRGRGRRWVPGQGLGRLEQGARVELAIGLAVDDLHRHRRVVVAAGGDQRAAQQQNRPKALSIATHGLHCPRYPATRRAGIAVHFRSGSAAPALSLNHPPPGAAIRLAKPQRAATLRP
jgi:hypothetical protein